MLVFLKTSEEATCVPNDTCAWTYTARIPEVTNITTEWDDRAEKYHVVVTGTGFTGTVDTTSLFSEGKEQRTLSLTSTQATFEVTDMSTALQGMKLYFDVGTPKGHDTVIDGTVLKLVPKLISISETSGSVGGSII